jgi:hypothetical protein
LACLRLKLQLLDVCSQVIPFDNVTFELADTRKDSTERVVNQCPQQREAQRELIAAIVYPGQVEGVIEGPPACGYGSTCGSTERRPRSARLR